MKNFAKRSTAAVLSILIGASVMPTSQVSAEKETAKNVKSSVTQKDASPKTLFGNSTWWKPVEWSEIPAWGRYVLLAPTAIAAGTGIVFIAWGTHVNARSQLELDTLNLIHEYGDLIEALYPYQKLMNLTALGEIMPSACRNVTFDGRTFNETAFWNRLADHSGGNVTLDQFQHDYLDEADIAGRIVLSLISDFEKTFKTIVTNSQKFGIPVSIHREALCVTLFENIHELSNRQLSGFINSIRGPINDLKNKMRHLGHIKHDTTHITTVTGKTVVIHNH